MYLYWTLLKTEVVTFWVPCYDLIFPQPYRIWWDAVAKFYHGPCVLWWHQRGPLGLHQCMTLSPTVLVSYADFLGYPSASNFLGTICLKHCRVSISTFAPGSTLASRYCLLLLGNFISQLVMVSVLSFVSGYIFRVLTLIYTSFALLLCCRMSAT